MYCKHCGKPIKEDDEYCLNCGKPLKPSEKTGSKLSGKKKWITLLAAGTAAAFICGGLLFGLGQANEKKAPEDQTQKTSEKQSKASDKEIKKDSDSKQAADSKKESESESKKETKSEKTESKPQTYRLLYNMNVRSKPDKASDSLGVLNAYEIVTLRNVQSNNGETWGETENGQWICMKMGSDTYAEIYDSKTEDEELVRNIRALVNSLFINQNVPNIRNYVIDINGNPSVVQMGSADLDGSWLITAKNGEHTMMTLPGIYPLYDPVHQSILSSSGRQGSYRDNIYQYQNGAWIQVFDGYYTEPFMGDTPPEYEISGSPVSESEYNSAKNRYFDQSGATDLSQNSISTDNVSSELVDMYRSRLEPLLLLSDQKLREAADSIYCIPEKAPILEQELCYWDAHGNFTIYIHCFDEDRNRVGGGMFSLEGEFIRESFFCH